MKILLRILVTPFIFGIIFIKFSWHAIHITSKFIRFGGELITYDEPNETKTIKDIYMELKNAV